MLFLVYSSEEFFEDGYYFLLINCKCKVSKKHCVWMFIMDIHKLICSSTIW